MEYFVDGEITFKVSIDSIEAESFAEAEAKAKAILKDFYSLNVVNAYHDAAEADIEVFAGKYDDEDKSDT